MPIQEIKKQIERIKIEQVNDKTQYNKIWLNNRRIYLEQMLIEKTRFLENTNLNLV